MINKKIFMVISLFAAFLPSMAAAAVSEDANINEIERVEVTGSRLAEDIKEVPAPAYVITKEDIDSSGARSVQDVLERIPGVLALHNSAAMAQAKGVTVRGLNAGVLLLVDGIPFMGANHGVGADLGSPFDLRAVPLESVERIELVKGASSAIYGSNAAAGVINIITRKGADKSSASVKVEGGSGGWFKGTVRGTAVTSDDLKVTVGYTRTQETGDVKLRLADAAAGKYDYAKDYRGNDYLLRVEKGNWSLLGEFGDFKSKWDYTNNYTHVQEEDSQENKYTRLSLNYADEANTGKIYYNRSKRDIFDLSGTTNYEDKTVGVIYNHKQLLGELPFIWGIDWRKEDASYANIGNPYGNNKPYDLSRNGFAPYAELSVPVGEAAFDLGLRYEHWNVDSGDNVDELIPRVSLNWQSASGKIWYVTAGRYFAMPSFFQMFYADSYGSSLPNPNLKPEKGWTYDIGVKDATAKNPWNIGLFYMEMEDKINYKFDGVTYVGSYVNIDKYRAWGVEAQVKFNLSESWSYTQQLTFTDADEKRENGIWTRSDQPRWQASGFVNYKNGPWLGEIAMHYYGDRQIKSDVYDDEDIFTVNASLAWNQENHTIRAACNNIFDKEYYLNKDGYIVPERRFIVSYEYKF